MELQQFGWNAVTVSFLGTILLTFVEVWGLWQQKKAIWDNRSGQSVSVIWFSYVTALLGVAFIYGVSIKSIALVINSILLALLHIPILVGLWRFKGFGRIEKVLAACFLSAVVAAVFVPAKGLFFLLFSFGNIISSLTQPIEIWRNKSSGVVEIRLLVVYAVSTVFWVVYGYAIDDWVLQIICPAYLVILSLTTLLWFKYRKNHGIQEVSGQ